MTEESCTIKCTGILHCARANCQVDCQGSKAVCIKDFYHWCTKNKAIWEHLYNETTEENLMNNQKKFYRANLHETSQGLEVYFQEWVSIHETPCYHYCINAYNRSLLSYDVIHKGEMDKSPLQKAKRMKAKIKKVMKGYSRFASETKEEAFKALVYRKQCHLSHLKRDVDILGVFLKEIEEMSLNDLTKNHGSYIVPNTEEIVN